MIWWTMLSIYCDDIVAENAKAGAVIPLRYINKPHFSVTLQLKPDHYFNYTRGPKIRDGQEPKRQNLTETLHQKWTMYSNLEFIVKYSRNYLLVKSEA